MNLLVFPFVIVVVSYYYCYYYFLQDLFLDFGEAQIAGAVPYSFSSQVVPDENLLISKVDEDEILLLLSFRLDD